MRQLVFAFRFLFLIKPLFRALAQLGVFQKGYHLDVAVPNALWTDWGYSRRDMERDNWADALHPDDREYVMAELTRQMIDYNFIELPEYRIITASGETRWVISKGVVVRRDSSGTITHYLGADFDITRRKRAEKQVERLLSEKARFLRDFRHRSKNQLKAIDMLLAQAEVETQPEAWPDGPPGSSEYNRFADIRRRVAGIRALNELLMHEPQATARSLQRVVTMVTESVRNLWDPAGTVTVTMDAEDIVVSEELGVALASILEECMTNAFKHAFPTSTAGRIHVRLYATSNDKIELLVEDDGSGFDGATNQGAGAFGLQAVQSLVEGKRGTLEIFNDHGTTIRATLPANS